MGLLSVVEFSIISICVIVYYKGCEGCQPNTAKGWSLQKLLFIDPPYRVTLLYNQPTKRRMDKVLFKSTSKDTRKPNLSLCLVICRASDHNDIFPAKEAPLSIR